MANTDTVELLKECDQGVRMGIDAIDEILPKVQSKKLKTVLENSKRRHEELKNELVGLLHDVGKYGEEPNVMAKGMSHLKTNFKMFLDESDQTIAGLMTDGCDMGIKSLNKYLNQYAAADENIKDITRRIIKVEEDLRDDIKGYL